MRPLPFAAILFPSLCRWYRPPLGSCRHSSRHTSSATTTRCSCAPRGSTFWLPSSSGEFFGNIHTTCFGFSQPFSRNRFFLKPNLSLPPSLNAGYKSQSLARHNLPTVAATPTLSAPFFQLFGVFANRLNDTIRLIQSLFSDYDSNSLDTSLITTFCLRLGEAVRARRCPLAVTVYLTLLGGTENWENNRNTSDCFVNWAVVSSFRTWTLNIF